VTEVPRELQEVLVQTGRVLDRMDRQIQALRDLRELLAALVRQVPPEPEARPDR